MKLIDYLKNWFAGIPAWQKALAAGIGSGIGFLIATGVANVDQTPVELVKNLLGQLGSFSTSQWIALVSVMLGVDLVTYITPNRG